MSSRASFHHRKSFRNSTSNMNEANPQSDSVFARLASPAVLHLIAQFCPTHILHMTCKKLRANIHGSNVIVVDNISKSQRRITPECHMALCFLRVASGARAVNTHRSVSEVENSILYNVTEQGTDLSYIGVHMKGFTIPDATGEALGQLNALRQLESLHLDARDCIVGNAALLFVSMWRMLERLTTLRLALDFCALSQMECLFLNKLGNLQTLRSLYLSLSYNPLGLGISYIASLQKLPRLSVLSLNLQACDIDGATVAAAIGECRHLHRLELDLSRNNFRVADDERRAVGGYLEDPSREFSSKWWQLGAPAGLRHVLFSIHDNSLDDESAAVCLSGLLRCRLLQSLAVRVGPQATACTYLLSSRLVGSVLTGNPITSVRVACPLTSTLAAALTAVGGRCTSLSYVHLATEAEPAVDAVTRLAGAVAAGVGRYSLSVDAIPLAPQTALPALSAAARALAERCPPECVLRMGLAEGLRWKGTAGDFVAQAPRAHAPRGERVHGTENTRVVPEIPQRAQKPEQERAKEGEEEERQARERKAKEEQEAREEEEQKAREEQEQQAREEEERQARERKAKEEQEAREEEEQQSRERKAKEEEEQEAREEQEKQAREHHGIDGQSDLEVAGHSKDAEELNTNIEPAHQSGQEHEHYNETHQAAPKAETDEGDPEGGDGTPVVKTVGAAPKPKGGKKGKKGKR